jgi:hypothetical protein
MYIFVYRTMDNLMIISISIIQRKDSSIIVLSPSFIYYSADLYRACHQHGAHIKADVEEGV